MGQRADARAGAERSRCWGGAREFRSQIDLETRATEATNQHLRDFAAAALSGHGLGVRPTGRHDVIALELGTMRVHVVTFDSGGGRGGRAGDFEGSGLWSGGIYVLNLLKRTLEAGL